VVAYQTILLTQGIPSRNEGERHINNKWKDFCVLSARPGVLLAG